MGGFSSMQRSGKKYYKPELQYFITVSSPVNLICDIHLSNQMVLLVLNMAYFHL